MNTTSDRIRAITRRLRDRTTDEPAPTPAAGYRIGCSCFNCSAQRLLNPTGQH